MAVFGEDGRRLEPSTSLLLFQEIAMIEITPEELDNLAAYCKEHNLTITDLQEVIVDRFLGRVNRITSKEERIIELFMSLGFDE